MDESPRGGEHGRFDSDQFNLGRDFARIFDVIIDLNNGLIRIKNPDRKYVK